MDGLVESSGKVLCVVGERRWESKEMNFYGAHTVHHQLCEEQTLAHTSSSLKSPNKPHPLRTGFIICTLHMKKLRLREIKELCPHHKLRHKNKIWNWIFVCKVHVFSIPLNCYLWFMLKHYITAGKLRPLLFLLTKHFLPWLSECPRETFFILSLLPSLGQWISDLNKVTKEQAFAWSGCLSSLLDNNPTPWNHFWLGLQICVETVLQLHTRHC